MARICFLAPAESIHTQKWVTELAKRGHEVHLISFGKRVVTGVVAHKLRCPILLRNATFPLKLLCAFIQLRLLLRRLQPDILHAVYVTNNGLFAALSGFHPFIVTALGSDVLGIPENRGLQFIKSFVARYVLRKADAVTCDSETAMKTICHMGVSAGKVKFIQFGVNMDKFKPRKVVLCNLQQK